MQRFFDLDFSERHVFSDEKALSVEDKRFLDMVEQATVLHDGHYEVCLPILPLNCQVTALWQSNDWRASRRNSLIPHTNRSTAVLWMTSSLRDMLATFQMTNYDVMMACCGICLIMVFCTPGRRNFVLFWMRRQDLREHHSMTVCCQDQISPTIWLVFCYALDRNLWQWWQTLSVCSIKSECLIQNVIYSVSCGGPTETQAVMWLSAACTLTSSELPAPLQLHLMHCVRLPWTMLLSSVQMPWIQSLSPSMWMIAWRLWQLWKRPCHCRLNFDLSLKREDSVWLVG